MTPQAKIETPVHGLIATLVAAACALLLLTGCPSISAAHVKADRDTWNSLNPWILEKADLTIERDQQKLAVWNAWELELRAAEGKLQ